MEIVRAESVDEIGGEGRGRGKRGGPRTEARRRSILPARRSMKETKREEEQRTTQDPCTPVAPQGGDCQDLRVSS